MEEARDILHEVGPESFHEQVIFELSEKKESAMLWEKNDPERELPNCKSPEKEEAQAAELVWTKPTG